MNFTCNITARQLLVSRQALTALGPGVVHQNDRFTVSVWLTEETGVATQPTTVVALPAEFTRISMGARPVSNLEEEGLLFSAVDFEAVGSGQALHYEAMLSLNTEEIDAKFEALGATARSIEALLDIELSNADNTKRKTIVLQWPVTIRRDIFRGTEGVPTPGTPTYPPADALALNTPEDGGYRILGGVLELWNPTQAKYQPIALSGDAGEETLVVLEDQEEPEEPSQPYALKAPTEGSYLITDGGILQLWNVTQEIYQPVALSGAAGAEAFVVLEELP